MLLALDPGMNSPGIALFGDDNKVLAAGYLSVQDYDGLQLGERWCRVARLLVGWTLHHITSEPNPLHIVFEKPQVYSEVRGKSKGDPNHLISIAGVAANFTGHMSARCNVDIMSPTPGEWIGQLPKVCPSCKGKKTVGGKGKGSRAKLWCKECHGSAWGTPRGRRIRSRLSEAEIALVPDQNDAIDAVGIGLWAVGRLERHSVFTNGRDGR